VLMPPLNRSTVEQEARKLCYIAKTTGECALKLTIRGDLGELGHYTESLFLCVFLV